MKDASIGGGIGDALRPRFVAAPAARGLYESLYLTAHHPSEPRALWVRHTVLKPPGGQPRAALWFTWFDSGTGPGVRAAKVTTPDVSTTPDHPLEVGAHGWIGPAGSAGAVESGQLRARWNLRFRHGEAPFPHLPRPWMYAAPFPRTKSVSATPYATLGGDLHIDGQAVDVDGWPCTVGHNWGAEHAEHWIWMHADATADDQPVWFDAVAGRIRLGPLTTPWIANGAVSISGHRHRLGGLRSAFETPVTQHERGATIVVRGRGIAVTARAEIDLAACVAWTYADPAGNTREVVNSSVARVGLTIERSGQPALKATGPVSAFEVGAARRAFDVPLEPFAD